MSSVYDAFGPVPPHIAPSIKVRRWDQGLLAGLATFLIVFAGLLWAGVNVPGSIGSFGHHFIGALSVLGHYATGTHVLGESSGAYMASIHAPWQVAWRVGLPLLLALAATAWVLKSALTPRSNTWHLSGPRLLKGREAIKRARSLSVPRSERINDPFALSLHPDLVLSKKQWSRHMWMTGSVGSGKSVILSHLIEQICARDLKAFIYDSKGDFTSQFRRPVIVSVFDKRSYIWDIGQDLRTPSQAADFAASIVPEEGGNGRFWSIAAQQLLTGSIRTLQDTRGTDWGWSDLAQMLARSAPAMLPDLLEHYNKAAPLIANSESQATSSVLATLAGYTRAIDDLAMAWPKRTKRMFSITQWVKDDYTNGRNQVIVQGGPDVQLSRAYVAAMLNVAVPSIISAQLPDSEQGRFIGFLLDELPSLGKVNLPPLIDRGRSKGVVVVCGMQDTAQLKEIYGENIAKSLLSMVGTNVVCQVQAGETRDEIAHRFGKRKVAWRTHGEKAEVHEEARAVVSANRLTDELGFRRGKAMGPERWGIRAIVQVEGDPMMLNFPGKSRPAVRDGQVVPRWMRGPAKPGKPAATTPAKPTATTTSTHQVLSLSMDEVRKQMDRIYSDDQR